MARAKPAPNEPPPASAPDTPTVNKGGRPPIAFWDDMWVAVFVQVYEGKLGEPLKQARIEKAMLDWATANGYALSEPSARTRARKLFQALKREG